MPTAPASRDAGTEQRHAAPGPPDESPATLSPRSPTSPGLDEEHFRSASDSAKFLYASYFFAAWGDRMWEFAAIVFLLDIFPLTLLPPSLFGFCESAAGIAFGPRIGEYIDHNDRLRVIRSSITGQNLVIMCASSLFCAALLRIDQLSYESKCVVVGLIVAAGMVAKVSSSMNKISIHKDWAVVVAGGSRTVQTRINSVMRRVDLTCAILAPMTVGILSSVVGSAYTCLIIALWSVMSLGVEFYLSGVVYQRVPQLQVKASPSPSPSPSPKKHQTNKQQAGSEEAVAVHGNCLIRQIQWLKIYAHHRAFGASLPYCMLYMSVLSFGGTMVAYLRTLGVPDFWLAAGRGFAAFVAIGATFVVPRMISSRGLWKTGVITIWLQILCLGPLVVAFILVPTFEGQQAVGFIVVVFLTVAFSRFGLWGFDLAETQLMQELVEHHNAGAINGAQETLMNACYLFSFSQTMLFHDPRSFAVPTGISFSAIFLAALLFSRHSATQQDENQDEAQHQDQQCVVVGGDDSGAGASQLPSSVGKMLCEDRRNSDVHLELAVYSVTNGS